MDAARLPEAGVDDGLILGNGEGASAAFIKALQQYRLGNRQGPA